MNGTRRTGRSYALQLLYARDGDASNDLASAAVNWVDAFELGAAVHTEEEDAVAGAGGDGRAELQRAVGEADGTGGGGSGQTPEVGVSAAAGLKDEGPAIGGPDATTF